MQEVAGSRHRPYLFSRKNAAPNRLQKGLEMWHGRYDRFCLVVRPSEVNSEAKTFVSRFHYGEGGTSPFRSGVLVDCTDVFQFLN